MIDEAGKLTGLRVLVVEDIMLVAEMIADALEQEGCDVVGPAGNVDAALALVHEMPLDGAVLDVNLGGTPCFAVAAALDSRSVPYVFLTGYAPDAAFPAQFQGVPRLTKPIDENRLVDVLADIFQR